VLVAGRNERGRKARGNGEMGGNASVDKAVLCSMK
jgi:hypothetical protein